MDLIAPEEVAGLAAEIAAADAVVPVGGGTHAGIGGDPGPGLEVRAPTGVAGYDPAELTVTVGAGTTIRALDALLAEAGQECALDPREPEATVGGVLAAGLSGHRRLRHGPLRDRVLEVRFITAHGRVVKAGGPTVKNVSGYDLPRLLVGSLGTIGVIVQVTLRCQPRPRRTLWATTAADPVAVRRALFRPSCLAWDGHELRVLLEGDATDVDAQLHAAALTPGPAPPRAGHPHRGRISVGPARAIDVGRRLDALESVQWLAELGVGTVHVASDTVDGLARARAIAHECNGWLLREAGSGGLDGFGRPLPNLALHTRLRDAFDPTRKLSPGRMPG